MCYLSWSSSASVAEAGLSDGEAAVALGTFVVLASLSVAGAVAYRQFGGARARAHLEDLKGWLGVHNAAVMAAILLVLGAKLLGDGLGQA